jgi:SH3 domain protein
MDTVAIRGSPVRALPKAFRHDRAFYNFSEHSPIVNKLIFTLMLSCLPGLLHAALQKGYVTDKLDVQMRSGPGAHHKVAKNLSGGTPVTVLFQSNDNGYTLVRLENGEEGWILSRHFSTDTPAQVLYDESSRKLEQTQEENRRLKEEVNQLRTGKDGSDKTVTQLHSDNDRLNSELISVRHASSNALQIQSERDRLQARVVELERDFDSLQREKQILDDDYRQDWFLIGAGVLGGGMLLGWLLPRLGWRRKGTWNSF